MTIAELKARKEMLGMTYDELAEKTGLARSTLTRIFSPRAPHERATASSLAAIAKALGVHEDGTTDTVKETITPREYRLLSAYRDLDETTQTLCVVLVEKLAEKTPRK